MFSCKISGVFTCYASYIDICENSNYLFSKKHVNIGIGFWSSGYYLICILYYNFFQSIFKSGLHLFLFKLKFVCVCYDI